MQRKPMARRNLRRVGETHQIVHDLYAPEVHIIEQTLAAPTVVVAFGILFD
jgi:hypothetical protein